MHATFLPFTVFVMILMLYYVINALILGYDWDLKSFIKIILHRTIPLQKKVNNLTAFSSRHLSSAGINAVVGSRWLDRVCLYQVKGLHMASFHSTRCPWKSLSKPARHIYMLIGWFPLSCASSENLETLTSKPGAQILIIERQRVVKKVCLEWRDSIHLLTSLSPLSVAEDHHLPASLPADFFLSIFFIRFVLAYFYLFVVCFSKYKT